MNLSLTLFHGAKVASFLVRGILQFAHCIDLLSELSALKHFNELLECVFDRVAAFTINLLPQIILL